MSAATAATAPAAAATPPILTVAEGRALVRLNRPAQHNRLEPDDLETLSVIFDRVDRDGDIRALILTGTGKSFSSGFHIGALAERKAKADREHDPDAFERTVDRLEALRVPTIAALNGGVYGGSTDLALACDFRLGVPDTRMFMPAARLGIVYYPSGLRRYVNRLGLGAAKRMFLTAEPLGTAELLRIGYLDEVVPSDRLMARAEELAATIASNAPLAVAATKRALNEVAAGRLDADELREARRRCSASEDHQEGLRAWAEKRAPVFKGR
jgi:enoyl-CoA hydratase/carnithine racemase